MGDCLMKGEQYEADRKEKQELLILKMRYLVWGAETLTKKEYERLEQAGEIKKKNKVHILQFKVDKEEDRVAGPGGGHDHDS